MDKYTEACAFGRFQVFHNGHLEHLKLAAARCHHLLIGISNPSPGLSKENPNEPHRTSIIENPLDYFERMRMIESIVGDILGHDQTYEIIPFPIDVPEKIKIVVPLGTPMLLSRLENWGDEKKARLSSAGFPVFDLPVTVKPISASTLRKWIREGNNEWKNHVPKGVIEYLEKNGLLEKVKNPLS